jgi:mono/diheme cytochrome c family protein
MQTVKLLFVAAALAACALACGGSSNEPISAANARPTATVTQAPAANNANPAATPDPLATARADYSQSCARCHKQDGTGGTAELEDGKTVKVANLREHGRKDTDAQLAKIIRDGHKGMPAFKNRLDDQRIEALVRLIRVEFHDRPAGSAPAASPAR